MQKLILGLLFIHYVAFGFAQSISWLVQSGGEGMDLARDLVVDHGGNVYTTGSVGPRVLFGDTLFESPNLPIGNKGYVQKVDTDGKLEWVFVLDGNGSAEGLNLAVDSQSNLYVVGTFSGSIDFDPDPIAKHVLETTADYRLFLLKIGPEKTFEWVITLENSEAYVEADVTLDSFGNIYLGGLFSDPIDLDPGPNTAAHESQGSSDIFYAKYSGVGELIWSISMGSDRNDALLELVFDPTSNTLVSTGYFRNRIDTSSDGQVVDIAAKDSWDAFVQKLDTSGQILWTRAFGGLSLDVGQAIDVDDQGNIYSGGSFMTIVDFDPGPDLFILTALGADESGLLVNDDGYIQKLDAGGNFIWARSLRSAQTGIIYDLDVFQDDIYVTGNFSDRLFLELDTTTSKSLVGNITPFFTSFVGKYDLEGSFREGFSIGGGDPSIDQRIEIFNDRIILAGNFSESVDFLMGENHRYHSRGILDAYVAKINLERSTADLAQSPAKLHLFPNPTKEEFLIELPPFLGSADLKIFDVMGSLHLYRRNYGGKEPINVSQLPAGVYHILLEMKHPDGEQT